LADLPLARIGSKFGLDLVAGHSHLLGVIAMRGEMVAVFLEKVMEFGCSAAGERPQDQVGDIGCQHDRPTPSVWLRFNVL
jgi:hypothetical protein